DPHQRRARCRPHGRDPRVGQGPHAHDGRPRNLPMSRVGGAATVIWALAVLAAATIAVRTTYLTDLSAFLPRAPSATQRLLIEQLRAGPAARLLIAAIGGGDATTRAQVSAALAARLRADASFASVSNGDAASLERDREFLFRNRYLLSEAVTPQRFTA